MPRKIQFEGQTHLFPDDATDEEIAAALEAMSADGPLAPQDNAGGVGHTLGDNRKMSDEQILTTLKAQLSDPYRDTASDAELRSEIARISKRASAAAPAAASAPRAFQADVRASEPPGTTLAAQEAAERGFDAALKAWLKTPRGQYYAGPEAREQFAKATGRRDPLLDREGAELQHARETGDVPYGTGTTYQVVKPLASMAGFALGGPAGATGAEAGVRFLALANNLDKAVKAGAIDEDRAADILTGEMLKGTAVDAAWNVGVPIVGTLAKKLPGATWLTSKMEAAIGRMLQRAGRSATPPARQSVRDAKIESRAKQTDIPERQQAVRELSSRVEGDFVPTPGQVRGSTGLTETAVQKAFPQGFKQQEDAMVKATEGMREELMYPKGQPSAKALGSRITDAADELVAATKKRLRPVFKEADELNVTVNMTPVAAVAGKYLKQDAKVVGGNLTDAERAHLQKIVADAKANPSSSAEAALDFISAQKEKMRSLNVDGKPSDAFKIVVGDLTEAAETAYSGAARRAGRGDVVQKLEGARKDYRTMMETVYDDAVKAALKKNPEDIGRLFWQSGNVSEIEQLHKMLALSEKEGTMGKAYADKLKRDVTRGFMQEAVPTVDAAARWSQMLKESPQKARTWATLTAGPEGKALKEAMTVLEHAAQIAKGSGMSETKTLIPFGRAAAGGLGVSYVTGVIHPGMAAIGLSVAGVMKMMSTAYVRSDKGTINLLTKVLRMRGTGTPAATQALRGMLPGLEQVAAEYGIDDIFVPADEETE